MSTLIQRVIKKSLYFESGSTGRFATTFLRGMHFLQKKQETAYKVTAASHVLARISLPRISTGFAYDFARP
jgi:hypothetical protein